MSSEAFLHIISSQTIKVLKEFNRWGFVLCSNSGIVEQQQQKKDAQS